MTGKATEGETDLFLTRSNIKSLSIDFWDLWVPLFDTVSDMFWYLTVFFVLFLNGGMGLEPVSALYLLGLGMFALGFSDND